MKKVLWSILAVVMVSGLLLSQSPARPVATEGRFQIFFSPLARADTFLVDEQTGRVWQFVTFTNIEGDPKVWRLLPRLDNDADETAWSAKKTFKDAAK